MIRIRSSGVFHMVIRKIVKTNSTGTIGVNIPKEFVDELGITENSYMNIEKVGNSIHMNRVVLG